MDEYKYEVNNIYGGEDNEPGEVNDKGEYEGI